ncbi:MAG: peptidoglycan recognition protein, partial [Myxococcota bacterium]|nr:peptidoglycan recognition protein [Myxococcota bacterium]
MSDRLQRVRSLLALAGVLALSGAVVGCQQAATEEEEADDFPQVAYGHDEIVGEWTLEEGYYVSPVLEAPLGATRVGVLLTTLEPELPEMMTEVPTEMPALDVRTAADGTAGAWAPIEHDWSEEGVHVGIADLGDPVMGVQLRIDASLVDVVESLTFSAVLPAIADTEPSDELEPETIEEVDEVGLATEALRSDLARLGVRSRASWGARAGRGCSSNTSKYRFAIHHTVSPQRGNVAAMVRGFQRYHMSTNGWCDIGYHFLVGRDGTVYEGRPLTQLGAHVGGHNTGNIGIAFVGCFDRSCPSSMGSRVPSDAAIRGAARVIHRLSRVHGISISTRTLLGHRQHSGQSTACPGQNLLDRLGRLRTLARSGG